jgi:hypothetical protein
MNGINRIKTDERFDFIDGTIGFQRADGMYFATANKPIQRRHGSAIFEKGCIEQYHWFAIGCANNNTEFALWNASDKTSNRFDIFGRRRIAAEQH